MEQTKNDRCNAIEPVLQIIERLRSETGCPWDRKQTPETIQTYLVEESHEAAAAVRAGKVEEVAEELGDVLFMVFFLTYLYEQRGDFTLENVCKLISEKMIRRHPHVFGDTSVSTAEEVKDNWEKIKTEEKHKSGKKKGEPVPRSLPALIRAYRILSRLSQKVDADPVWNDLQKQGIEFARESAQVVHGIEQGRIENPDDMGRIFTRLVNIARLQGYRAEDILHNFLREIE